MQQRHKAKVHIRNRNFHTDFTDQTGKKKRKAPECSNLILKLTK